MEKKSLEDQKIDFLLAARKAVRNNQMTIIMFYNPEKDSFTTLSNSYGMDFDEVMSMFNDMPFLGRMTPDDAFEEWKYYYEDVALAEIYGFELEDGTVQFSIADGYVMPGMGEKEEEQSA